MDAIYIPQVINALTALTSGLIGVVGGGWATFLVQRGLAQRARDDQKSAVAAMFVADIRALNHWLVKTNMVAALDAFREYATAVGASDPNMVGFLRLFAANVAELDETIHRKQALLAGSMGLVAVDVATVYTTLISLKGNLAALSAGLYDQFPMAAKISIIDAIQSEIAVFNEAERTIVPKLLKLIR